MWLFENTVTLRGFLGLDAKVPPSDGLTGDSYAVLLLATVSGVWDLGANEWKPRTDWHRIICPGPFFCGFTRGMKRGDYLEVEGELRGQEQTRTVVVAGDSHPVHRTLCLVHATRIHRLDRPDALVDTGESD
jgi:hypothetical protein